MIYTSISIDFDLLNAMKPSILSKNHSLTSKGHPEGQNCVLTILLKIGNKKSSISDQYFWIIFKYFKFDLNIFKRK